jgi:hypothetical protein
MLRRAPLAHLINQEFAVKCPAPGELRDPESRHSNMSMKSAQPATGEQAKKIGRR